MILYIGDVNTDNTKLPNNPILVTKDDINKPFPEYAFTTLVDVGSVENLYHLMDKATEVIFITPEAWSDGKTVDSIYSIAWTMQQLRDIHNKKITNNNPLIDIRKSEKKHLFVAGCSVSHGVGLDNEQQRYAKLLSHHYNLPLVSLTKARSSLEWASDQILRSDIRKGDLVIWGLTTNERYMHFMDDSKELTHFLASSITQYEELFIKLLFQDNLLEKNILRIERVHNFCKKAKANLIILNCISNLFISSRISHLDSFLFLHNKDDYDNHSFLDLGLDNRHPGPLTHKFYADKIIEKVDTV